MRPPGPRNLAAGTAVKGTGPDVFSCIHRVVSGKDPPRESELCEDFVVAFLVALYLCCV